MSMMTVLDKSVAIICPDRNKEETEELRKRITEVYHQSKVSCEMVNCCLLYTSPSPRDS